MRVSNFSGSVYRLCWDRFWLDLDQNAKPQMLRNVGMSANFSYTVTVLTVVIGFMMEDDSPFIDGEFMHALILSHLHLFFSTYVS